MKPLLALFLALVASCTLCAQDDSAFRTYVHANQGAGAVEAQTALQTYGKAVVVVTGTGAVTGSFFRIDVMAAATFSTLTDTRASGDAMTGFAVPALQTLWGTFTAVQLTGGKIRLYSN